MKIIFYTTDSTVEKFFSTLDVGNCILVSALDDIKNEISTGEHSLIFLDFDCSELNCAEVAIELNPVENVNTILISGKLSLKEIMDFQGSDSTSACDAYLTKPLSVEILTGVINDFEIALSTTDDNSETKDSGVSNIDLTFVGVKKDLLDELASSPIEEVSEDESEEMSAVEVEVEVEDEDEEESVDFNATPMTVASEVRDVIDSHKSTGTNFENVVNDEIQRKFDAVFDREESENKTVEDKEITPQGFSEVGVDDEENNVIKFESEQIVPVQEETENEVGDQPEAPLEEVQMSNKNDSDDGLEFKIPEETSTDITEDKNQEVESDLNTVDIDVDNDTAGLEFKIGDKDQDSSEDTLTATDTQSEDDLEFSDVTSDGFDLGSLDETPESIQEDDGLSFDNEGSGELSLGEDSDEVENIDVDDSLSFDDEELDLNETYDSEPETLEAATDDELDLNETTEDEGMSFEEGDTTDPSFEMGSDTSSDIESTISSIVAPDNSDENSTGEFDLSATSLDEEETDSMQEFDYKTSSGFAPLEADEFGDIDDSVGDNTNPTVVANTSSITSALFDSSDNDEVDDEELSFNDPQVEEIPEIEEDLEDYGATQTAQSSFEVSESEAPVASTESFTRNYDEDELLRLQGTIRQLREERESLMESINSLTSEKQLLSQDNLGLKAELDEVKIELEIVKKRSQDEVNEMKYQMNLSHEKKDVYEMKYKTLYKEFDRLNQKVRIDFNQVKQREKELESKLELVVMDSDSQVQTRDMKILELKRKIDSLEFNMENTTIREQKHREDKSKLEERLAKIMKTLRGSIQLIEDDLEVLDIDNTTELDKN